MDLILAVFTGSSPGPSLFPPPPPPPMENIVTVVAAASSAPAPSPVPAFTGQPVVDQIPPPPPQPQQQEQPKESWADKMWRRYNENKGRN